jgi:hypothetical protein
MEDIMPVTYTSTERKQAILAMLPGASRIGNGQRWVIQLSDGKRAMLKTSLNDNIMVKTDVPTPEDAVLSGFTDDVEYVLAVTGEIGDLQAFLIPVKVVENAFRTRQRAWMDADPENRSNTTWALSNLGGHFTEYKYDIEVKAITPDEAKRRLAVHFRTTPEKINISVTV